MTQLQLCTFELDQLLFGIEVSQVQEIVRYHAITRVPLAPEVVRGLINLRGEIVTALDLRLRMGMPRHPPDGLPMNIVLRHEGSGGVSLLVDRVGDVIDVAGDKFERPPETVQGAGRELIRGAYKLPERLLLLLDVDQTISIPKFSEPTALGRPSSSVQGVPQSDTDRTDL